MEKITLPESIEVTKTDTHQATITIAPCFPGYGNTLGNSLRRVLLSSLPGAAVATAKIKNISHEFTSLPGVKEDTVEIILNLKRLRFILHDVDEVKVNLKVKGEKKITGKDLTMTSDVEIANPGEEIATLTTKDAELEMELTIRSGRGFMPVENIDKKQNELGVISIDSIFTPVKNVNYTVENVRVGQMTNYDKLVMKVTTDGTITPEDALKQASLLLVEHFSAVAGDLVEPAEKPATKTEKTKASAAKKKDTDDEEEDEKPKKKRGRPKKES